MFESLLNSGENSYMWQWAFAHPYLHTFIKLGTPSLYAIILYVGFRIITKIFAPKNRR